MRLRFFSFCAFAFRSLLVVGALAGLPRTVVSAPVAATTAEMPSWQLPGWPAGAFRLPSGCRWALRTPPLPGRYWSKCWIC